MPASVQNPEDVVNLALRRMGYKLRVGSLLDGSQASQVALDIYAQTRDELLRQNDWGFAERNIMAVLLKSAPAGGYGGLAWDGTQYPAIPWAFEYAWPDDCLKVRALKPVPIFLQTYDPQPNLFTVANDNYFTPARKVILSNVENAALVYTGQITNPVSWESDFVEALAAALARRLAPGLVGLQVAQLEAGDESASTKIAEMEQG